MEKIILVQHCQSEHHINDMTGGWTDSVLTRLGEEQAGRIANKLKSFFGENSGVEIYSSDLLRASQTATIIGKSLKLSVSLDKGLREINTGIAINQTKDWARNNRNPMKNTGFDLNYREFDYGESWGEFYQRVSNCMESILRSVKSDEMIIVTHGGTIAYIVSWWLNFELEMLSSSYFQSSVGGITTLTKNRFNQHTVNVFNDTLHL